MHDTGCLQHFWIVMESGWAYIPASPITINGNEFIIHSGLGGLSGRKVISCPITGHCVADGEDRYEAIKNTQDLLARVGPEKFRSRQLKVAGHLATLDIPSPPPSMDQIKARLYSQERHAARH